MYAKWDITQKCNLRCTHCSVADMYFDPHNTAERQITHDERMNIITSLYEGGVTSLSLLGGEPLTLKDQLIDIVAYANSLGMKLTVVTNGQLLDAKTSSRLIDVGLDCLAVSIESSTPEIHNRIRGNGTFERLTKNLHTFLAIRGKSGGPHVTVNTVLSGANRRGFADMVPFCIDFGVDEWAALTLNYIGNALDNLDEMSLTEEAHTQVAIEIANTLKRHGITADSSVPKINLQLIYPCVWEFITKKYGLWLPQPEICCSAGSGLAYVSPSGDAHVCDRVHSSGFVGSRIITEEFTPINLLKTSFSDAWNSSQFIEMFEFAKRFDTYQNFEPCNHCKYLHSGVCNPCPLGATPGKIVRFEECLKAEEYLGDISSQSESPQTQWEELHQFAKRDLPLATRDELDEVVIKQFRLTKGVRHARQADGSILIMHPETTSFTKISPVSWAMLEDMNTGKCPREVIDEFMEDLLDIMRVKGIIPDQSQRAGLIETYAAFILHMYNKGFISDSYAIDA